VKILICDDHALFREGLELVLGQLDPAAELTSVGDAEAALARVAEHDGFDLVLLDLRLRGTSGFAALDELRRRHPEVPVVVISASESPADVRSALERGASGFIPKATRGSVLLAALRHVLAGGVYVPPLSAGGPEAPAPAETPPPALTERQIEVLRLLARGLTNREIADVLRITEETAKSHVKHIYSALDVSTRTEAVMRMRELGLED
jgi:DNA-binding NarL/FixJ family response regulator